MAPRCTRAFFAAAIVSLIALAPARAQQARYTLEQVKSYPFPTQLTASATGARIAWAFNERGLRNLWVAEAPEFRARRLTSYAQDDGQELTSVSLSPDGNWIVYIRGGDFGSNWDDALPVNPTLSPTPPEVEIWSVPFAGGEPKRIGKGEAPVISPDSRRIAFTRERQIWVAPIDGSAAAQRLFTARGDNEQPQWSPDGARLAFVSSRGDHAFVGVYADSATPILFVAPSTHRDGSPRWSPDGRRLVFVRRPGGGGAPDSVLVQRHNAWSLWVADASSGDARRIWQAPEALRGSVPTTHGGTNLHWAAGDRIVFLSYADGWPHLYSIAASGGEARLLTPGAYMAEHIRLSPDGRFLVFAANAGETDGDIDRRHVVRVPVDGSSAPEVVTPGSGLEWSPIVTGDGAWIAYVSATAQRPPLPAVRRLATNETKLVGADRLPADFPTGALVTPKQVVFTADDGVRVHGQLFEANGGPARKPAIIYIHGGPPRQMLLGWHYSDYYANAYALNQYLASLGFVVLSVNYRLGIGYGYEFHNPRDGGARGAAEYRDVVAGAHYLRSLPQVDPQRIGVYGGSYGGYLTALALARDSDLFAAGVDIHGVHDWTAERMRFLLAEDRYEKIPDARRAIDVAWQASPVADVDRWRSPVLLIHADDDRNVRFSQTVDLVRRLERAGVPFEELVIVDDTHHFMRHANQLQVNAATAEFFRRRLQNSQQARE